MRTKKSQRLGKESWYIGKQYFKREQQPIKNTQHYARNASYISSKVKTCIFCDNIDYYSDQCNNEKIEVYKKM